MRFFFFLLLLVICFATAEAQIHLGLSANYGASGIRNGRNLATNVNAYDNASSLSFGLVVMLEVSPVFSVRSGVNTNRRGTTVSALASTFLFDANFPRGSEAKVRFTYVDVPLLLQAHVPLAGKLRPYLFAGPSFGYATGGNLRITSGASGSGLMTNNIDLEEFNYERSHVAAVGGLGLQIALSESFSAFAEGQYEQSFSEPYPTFLTKEGYKAIRFGAGFAFRL